MFEPKTLGEIISLVIVLLAGISFAWCFYRLCKLWAQQANGNNKIIKK